MNDRHYRNLTKGPSSAEQSLWGELGRALGPLTVRIKIVSSGLPLAVRPYHGGLDGEIFMIVMALPAKLTALRVSRATRTDDDRVCHGSSAARWS